MFEVLLSSATFRSLATRRHPSTLFIQTLTLCVTTINDIFVTKISPSVQIWTKSSKNHFFFQEIKKKYIELDEEKHKRLGRGAFNMDLTSGKAAFDLGFQPSGIFPGLTNGVFNPQANMFGNYHQEWVEKAITVAS